jgi:hypothetical protein
MQLELSSRLEGEDVAYIHAFMATRRKSEPAAWVKAIDPGTHPAMPKAKLVSVNGQCRPGHDGASHLLLATLQRTASGWHWLAAAKPRQTLNPEPDQPSQAKPSQAKPSQGSS